VKAKRNTYENARRRAKVSTP